MAVITLALVAVGLVAALALAQLIRPEGTAAPGAPRAGTASSTANAPDLEAPLIDGGTFSLARERGRPVLVLFTASWCVSCIPEVNKMAQLHEEFGGRASSC